MAVPPQAVDGEVEVARIAGHALGLRPVDEGLEAAKAEQVLGRLDADAHLLAVVGARIREPVDDRAHGRAQDEPALGDVAGPVGVLLEGVLRVARGGHRRDSRTISRSSTLSRPTSSSSYCDFFTDA